MRIRHDVSTLGLVIAISVLGTMRLSAQSAVSPEVLQAANELNVVLSKGILTRLSDQLTAQLWPSLEESIRASAERANAKIDDTTMAQLRAEFERIQRNFASEALKHAPEIYARYFDEQELRDLSAFYRSPVGEKAQRLLPQVTADIFGDMKTRLEELEKETAEAFVKILRERTDIK